MSNSRRSLLPLTVLLIALSLTSILQLPQTAYSQQDYEELIITEANSDQKPVRYSGLSKIGSVEAQQELRYSYFSEWGSSGTDNGQFQLQLVLLLVLLWVVSESLNLSYLISREKRSIWYFHGKSLVNYLEVTKAMKKFQIQTLEVKKQQQ